MLLHRENTLLKCHFIQCRQPCLSQVGFWVSARQKEYFLKLSKPFQKKNTWAFCLYLHMHLYFPLPRCLHHITIYLVTKKTSLRSATFLTLRNPSSLQQRQRNRSQLEQNPLKGKIISFPYSKPKATTTFTSQLPPPVKSVKTPALP